MYATISDVKNQYRSLSFDEGSSLSENAVLSIMERQSALIDSVLVAYYQLPIISGDIHVLTELEVLLTVANVDEILAGVGGNAETLVRSQQNRVRADEIFRKIRSGEIHLVGAGRKTAGFANGNDEAGITPTFQRNAEQW